MLKIFSLIISKSLISLNYVFFSIFKRNFLGWVIFFLQNVSYKSEKIHDREIKFFIPNNLVDWRVRTFLTKEPDTIKWIENFDRNEKIIFWDIGANIGLYSIYAAATHVNNIEIVAFEPSSSNLRILSRNISINNLANKILINQIALNNKENIFLDMNEPDFIEGSSLNTFGEEFNFEGKKFNPFQKYKILGSTIDYFIKNNIHQLPNYIKIDVDGIEHLILEGAEYLFSKKHVKSVIIEINENYLEQKNKIISFMKKYELNFVQKENQPKNLSKKFINTFNYIFEKK